MKTIKQAVKEEIIKEDLSKILANMLDGTQEDCQEVIQLRLWLQREIIEGRVDHDHLKVENAVIFKVIQSILGEPNKSSATLAENKTSILSQKAVISQLMKPRLTKAVIPECLTNLTEEELHEYAKVINILIHQKDKVEFETYVSEDRYYMYLLRNGLVACTIFYKLNNDTFMSRDVKTVVAEEVSVVEIIGLGRHIGSVEGDGKKLLEEVIALHENCCFVLKACPGNTLESTNSGLFKAELEKLIKYYESCGFKSIVDFVGNDNGEALLYVENMYGAEAYARINAY